MVAGMPPGGGADVSGRKLAAQLGRVLKQNIVVENIAGAAGNSAAVTVAGGNPDGHTIFFSSHPVFAVNPILYEKLPFNPNDFQPVVQVSQASHVLLANLVLPATRVSDLITLARSKPRGINFASSGVGSSPHLCGELFNTAAGVDMVHVPYKGAGVATTDILSGQIQMFCSGLTALNALIKAGRMRPIGMATLKRSSLMPDIPTINEQGLKDFEVTSWTGIVAPAKTPRAIVQKLYDALARITQTDDMKQFVQQQGADMALLGPEAFAAEIKNDIAKWGKLVKAAKIAPE